MTRIQLLTECIASQRLIFASHILFFIFDFSAQAFPSMSEKTDNVHSGSLGCNVLHERGVTRFPQGLSYTRLHTDLRFFLFLLSISLNVYIAIHFSYIFKAIFTLQGKDLTDIPGSKGSKPLFKSVHRTTQVQRATFHGHGGPLHEAYRLDLWILVCRRHPYTLDLLHCHKVILEHPLLFIWNGAHMDLYRFIYIFLGSQRYITAPFSLRTSS